MRNLLPTIRKKRRGKNTNANEISDSSSKPNVFNRRSRSIFSEKQVTAPLPGERVYIEKEALGQWRNGGVGPRNLVYFLKGLERGRST